MRFHVFTCSLTKSGNYATRRTLELKIRYLLRSGIRTFVYHRSNNEQLNYFCGTLPISLQITIFRLSLSLEVQKNLATVQWVFLFPQCVRRRTLHISRGTTHHSMVSWKFAFKEQPWRKYGLRSSSGTHFLHYQHWSDSHLRVKRSSKSELAADAEYPKYRAAIEPIDRSYRALEAGSDKVA